MLAVLMGMVKLCVFVIIGGILLKSAHDDVTARTVENIYPYTILILALVNHWVLGTPLSYLTGLLISLPFIIAFYQNKIGGADVKLIIALSIYVGLRNGLILIIAALLAASIIETVKKVRSKSKSGYPFVPYLVLGYVIMAMPEIIRVIWS